MSSLNCTSPKPAREATRAGNRMANEERDVAHYSSASA